MSDTSIIKNLRRTVWRITFIIILFEIILYIVLTRLPYAYGVLVQILELFFFANGIESSFSRYAPHKASFILILLFNVPVIFITNCLSLLVNIKQFIYNNGNFRSGFLWFVKIFIAYFIAGFAILLDESAILVSGLTDMPQVIFVTGTAFLLIAGVGLSVASVLDARAVWLFPGGKPDGHG